jgi:hypothetical protein
VTAFGRLSYPFPPGLQLATHGRMPVGGVSRRVGRLFLVSFLWGLRCARRLLALPGRDFRHQETVFPGALPEALVLLVAIGLACRTL